MSHLQNLIEELCPEGVECRQLEECCRILDSQRKPVKKSERKGGEYPYYGANGIQDYVSEYIFEGNFVLVGEDGSVVTAQGKPIVTWASGKIWVNNHAHIIEEVDGVLLRYLYHYLQTVDVSSLIHGNIPKLTGRDFKAIQIPLPPLPVQREIVRILDLFTNLSAELTAELELRKKQYAYYRDKLLEFEGEDVEWVTLGEVAAISRGTRVTKSQLDDSYEYPVFQNALNSMGYYPEFNRDKCQTYVISAGAAGEIGFCDEKFWAADDCFTFECNGCIQNKFLYYVLLSSKRIIKTGVRHASIPRLSRSALEKIKLPLPPLEEQQRIVGILDKFDALVNDLTSGIPAEIEARKKQYEYYREKLLAFKRL